MLSFVVARFCFSAHETTGKKVNRAETIATLPSHGNLPKVKRNSPIHSFNRDDDSDLEGNCRSNEIG